MAGNKIIMLKELNLKFLDQIILDDVSCIISENDRIGLVGPNGSGKSTLLKIIAKLQSADSGEVALPKDFKIGYLAQEIVLQSTKSIYDETFSVFEKITALINLKNELEEKLSTHPEVIDAYADAQAELMEHDVEHLETDVKKMLVGLGFSQESFNTPVASLSGGWRMRIVLAKLLLQKADFYLFDEPTNHLDIVTKDWFLKFLKNANFGFMLVCHDRYFLDHACNKIFDIEFGHINEYVCNYEAYEVQKQIRAEEQEKAAEKQQREIAQKMKTVERFRASAARAKMAQSMLKKIEKIEPIVIQRRHQAIAIPLLPIARAGNVVLKIENVAQAFNGKSIFNNASFEVEREQKVAIVAPNGVGKSTLLNLIANKLPLQGGTITFGHNVTFALFEQEQEQVLDRKNTVIEEVENSCETSEARSLVRKFLGAFLFSGDAVYKKIGVLSGGERNRVAMAKVLLKQANLLILDEPTNHLDIQSKEILLEVLKQFKGTILFVSHDRDFLNKLATCIIDLTPRGTITYPGNYDSYIYHKEKIELTQANKAKPEQQVKSKPEPKHANEQQELQKKVAKIEKEIDIREKRIKELNTELGALEYTTEAFTSKYNQLLKVQKELDTFVENWETLNKLDR